MKQPLKNHNLTPSFNKYSSIIDEASNSDDTECHLDFLDKIEAQLEANPLTEESKAKAKVL